MKSDTAILKSVSSMDRFSVPQWGRNVIQACLDVHYHSIDFLVSYTRAALTVTRFLLKIRPGRWPLFCVTQMCSVWAAVAEEREVSVKFFPLCRNEEIVFRFSLWVILAHDFPFRCWERKNKACWPPGRKFGQCWTNPLAPPSASHRPRSLLRLPVCYSAQKDVLLSADQAAEKLKVYFNVRLSLGAVELFYCIVPTSVKKKDASAALLSPSPRASVWSGASSYARPHPVLWIHN